MIFRALFYTLLFTTTVVCANPPAPAAPSPPPPKEIQLQDPMPGQALLYLVRIPGDSATAAVLVDGAKVATMTPDSYTAISVAPGIRRLSATTPAGPEQTTEINLQQDERRFFYLLAPYTRPVGGSGYMFFGLLGAVVQETFNRPGVDGGSRVWTETPEPEAKGMMAGTTLVLPD